MCFLPALLPDSFQHRKLPLNDAIESGNSLESLLEDLRRYESEWREGAGLAALTTWEVSNMAVNLQGMAWNDNLRALDSTCGLD